MTIGTRCRQAPQAAALLLVALAATTDVLNDLATTAASREIEEDGG